MAFNKLSEIDAVIVRYADSMSPAAISFKIEGRLSPEQVMVRIGQLLDSPDWLTTAQQDQLVTLKMRQLVAELEEMPRTTRNAEVLLRGLEAVGARLEKRQAATTQDLTQLYAFQGVAMVDEIEKIVTAIKAKMPELSTLDMVRWNALLSVELRNAQMRLAKLEAGGAAEPTAAELKVIEKPGTVSGNSAEAVGMAS
jgi:hypothetical protein